MVTDSVNTRMRYDVKLFEVLGEEVYDDEEPLWVWAGLDGDQLNLMQGDDLIVFPMELFEEVASKVMGVVMNG